MSLKVLLFLSFQIFQIMKLGVRAQAESRTSLFERLLLHLLRVLMMLSVSLSGYWKMEAKECHNLEVKVQLLRRCSIVSS